MDFHAFTSKGWALIHTTDMPKYDKIDNAAVAAKRRNNIVSGRSLVPAGACHYCGHTVGRGALWCSTDCAKDYEAERELVNSGE